MARVAVAAVVVLVLAELGVRATADRFPTPNTWYHPSAQVKVDQMQAIADAGQRRPVVVVGTSQMAMGVDPAVLSSALPGHPGTYNAALLAGYPPVTRRFVPEEVVPRLQPELVVLGVSHLDLQEGPEPPYDEALATSRSRWAAAERWLSQRSYLVRHREALRDLARWPSLVAGTTASLVERYRTAAIGPEGVWTYPREGSCRDPQPVEPDDDLAIERAQPGGEAVGPRPVDPERVAAVWEVVAGLEAQGIDVAVVLAPLPDCHFEVADDRAAWEAARSELAAGAEDHGATWIDVTDEVGDDGLYYDTGHLHEAGSARFSALLADALVAEGLVVDGAVGRGAATASGP